ncbi:alkene reductase [Rhodococcus sp. IC4_135]|uniref:oxidoreductase n=1 Tax=Rhodococcus sp. IC4_135 TaxID=2715537 RepID=UPI001422D75C|nr:alkene reductase [Rhodococcus sp. IC4_135]
MKIGEIPVGNRVIMAPSTRLRAEPDGRPGEIVAQYYAQRASMGLIVSEGTFPTEASRGYLGQPGLVDDVHQAAWARVASAVHDSGGKIVVQLMHAGRLTHPGITGGREVQAPSAIAAPGTARTEAGKERFPVPAALTTGAAAGIADQFARAAKRAVAAGLDGVEIHAANGYLLHQFLAPNSNQRTDRYGGSPRNRARLVEEVIDAVGCAIGPGRVGLRISPGHDVQGTLEVDPADVVETYGTLVDHVSRAGLAYLSILHDDPEGRLVQGLRHRFAGPLVLNNGFTSVTTLSDACDMLLFAGADAVAVGRAAIANPDLVERWRYGCKLNVPRPQTFYVGGPEGYVDYPRR